MFSRHKDRGCAAAAAAFLLDLRAEGRQIVPERLFVLFCEALTSHSGV